MQQIDIEMMHNTNLRKIWSEVEGGKSNSYLS